MELRHLRYFMAVVDSGSLSAAAERLGIAQPPLGRQIRDLERFLGASLFERSSKGVRLTAAGSAFLPRAREILTDVGEAVEQVRQIASGSSGRLVVGYADEFLYGLLPRAAMGFLADHGDVRLALEMSYNTETAIAVYEGRYDAGLIVAPPPSHLDGIAVRPIDRVPLYVAVARDHPLAARSCISVRDLAGARVITSRVMPTSGYYIRVMQLLRANGIHPEFYPDIHPTEMIGHLVAGGCGLAIVSEDSISPLRDDLALLPLSDPEAVLDRCIVWRAGTPNPLTLMFVEAVLRAASPTQTDTAR